MHVWRGDHHRSARPGGFDERGNGGRQPLACGHAGALRQDPGLANFQGRVSDSGERRWTLRAAIDEGVLARVTSAAPYSCFESRGNVDYANCILSAMRFAFGGHVEQQA